MKFIICFLGFLLFVIINVHAKECINDLTLFLDRPTHKSYQQIMSPGGECWGELKTDTNKLARLYGHNRLGNKWAIKYLIGHLSSLDGGELEDAYIALGESIDTEPRILMRELKEQNITDNQFKQALEMLPLIYVDDKKGSLAALRLRKKRLNTVQDVGLKSLKEMAIKAISKQIEHIDKDWP